MLLRNLRPIRLPRRSAPFDFDQFIYELKIDGFRALAHVQDGRGELVSRNGNVFRGFVDLGTWFAEHLRVESAVLEGEIAFADEGGWSLFRDFLFWRRCAGSTRLVAFAGAGDGIGVATMIKSIESISIERTRLRGRPVLKTRVEKEVFHAIDNA